MEIRSFSVLKSHGFHFFFWSGSISFHSVYSLWYGWSLVVCLSGISRFLHCNAHNVISEKLMKTADSERSNLMKRFYFAIFLLFSKMRIIYGHCANMTELQQTDYSSWPKHNWIHFFFFCALLCCCCCCHPDIQKEGRQAGERECTRKKGEKALK